MSLCLHVTVVVFLCVANGGPSLESARNCGPCALAVDVMPPCRPYSQGSAPGILSNITPSWYSGGGAAATALLACALLHLLLGGLPRCFTLGAAPSSCQPPQLSCTLHSPTGPDSSPRNKV